MAEKVTIRVKPKTKLVPVQGDKAQGVPGLSAYELYLAHTSDDPKKTLDEWITSIKGEKGDQGEQGLQGPQGAQGIQGEKGDKGDDGLTTSIALNGTTYEQTGGTITLPDLLTPDGDGSTVTSDSADDADYNTVFPSQGNLWILSAWFSLIKAKVNRLFVLSTRVLTINATFNDGSWTFDPFDVSQFSRCVENAFEGSVIKIHFKGYDGGGGVILDIFYDGAYRYDEPIGGAEFIDCFELSRSFYIGGELYDTPMNVELTGYLFENDNGSNTTVNFAEAGATALPATGEKQSVLWGKALRYLKTVIPASLSAKIDIQGGDATNAESASNESTTYEQVWPTYVTKWSLLNWFGAIRAKLDYLFGKSALILNVNATRTLQTNDWTFGAFSTTEFAAIAAIAANGAPIYVRFAGTTGGVAEPIMLYPGLWNETLSQITSRDLARGFYLNGGVAANRGARSYDTQKYIDLGATFNNTTGYYEYLGLTNIVESECREAYYLTGCKFAAAVNFYGFGSLKTRFLFPLTNTSTAGTLLNAFNQTTGIKRVRLCKNPNAADIIPNYFYTNNMADAFANSSVDYVAGMINISGVASAANLVAFTGTNMIHILMWGIKVNVSFPASTLLDYESTKFLIDYSAATSTITLTLKTAVANAHRATYLLNPVPGYATLDLYAASKNITIATV